VLTNYQAKDIFFKFAGVNFLQEFDEEKLINW